MNIVRYSFNDFKKFEAIIDNNLTQNEKFGLQIITYELFCQRYSN